MYENCIHKNRRTHNCPSENLTGQPYETPLDRRPRDGNGRIVIYENCVYEKRPSTHICQSDELNEYNEHVYQLPVKVRESKRCQILWLTVSILLSAGVIGLTVYDIVFIVRTPIQCPSPIALKDVNNPMFCMNCTSVTIQIISRREACLNLLSITSEDGVHKCCAGNATQLTALFELCANTQDGKPEIMQKTREQGIQFTHASAHKRLLPPPDGPDKGKGYFYSGNGTRTLRLDPDSSDPLFEHARGINVLTEGFVVQFSGLYYVYSSIHYKPSATHAFDSCENKTWFHYVFRISPTIPDNRGLLLKTIHTGCGMCLKTSGTEFTGGVFNLKERELIQVEASMPNMVECGKESTYLGLMMLASDGT